MNALGCMHALIHARSFWEIGSYEAMDANDTKAGATDLAREWEGDPTVRRRAAVYTIVL